MEYGTGIKVRPWKKIVIGTIGAIAVVLLAGLGAWYLSSPGTTFPDTLEPITVGSPPFELSMYIYIAQDRDLFKKNGLNVTLRDDYMDGVAPLNDMVKGDLDIAVTAEYPVVAAIFNDKRVCIFASIDKHQNEKIIGRRDHGIKNTSDLKGKKVGVPRGTICEFFLGRFLELHGIGLQDVTLVDVPPSRAVDAIANGSIDAIIYYQPYVYEMEKRLGYNGISWQAQSNQLLYGVLVSRDAWIAAHPELINKFLRSLDEAEQYSIDHPSDAEAIVQKRLNFSDEYMATVWPNHYFSLSLDQSLLIAMSDEGHWMINNNFTSRKTLPYFQDYIYTKGIEEVKPESVNIR
ncbi:MAG: ABC transporter substrate-binding protein [Methanotrichaceae archaeon]